ncbi:MAG: hypothetical protein KKB13_17085 [Chloroflexi bacterium]|nr:hypothetical protein [Chloroflexota bacterium]
MPTQTARQSTDIPTNVSIVRDRYKVRQGGVIHMVDQAGACSCGSPNCPAIQVVQQYLVAGGRPAPVLDRTPHPAPLGPADPLPTPREPHPWRRQTTPAPAWTGFLPDVCYICGSAVTSPESSTGPGHYVCPQDPAHYWEWRLRQQWAAPTPEDLAQREADDQARQAMYAALVALYRGGPSIHC